MGLGQNVSRLGALLVHRKLITTATLDAALTRQGLSGRRLGAELVAMGAIQPADLLRTLATQSRAGYLMTVDPARARAPRRAACRATSSRRSAWCRSKRTRSAAASSSPVPRRCRAWRSAVLRALVTATVEPLLVDDDAAAALLEAYGTAPAQAARVTRAVSLRDAAERIALAIATRPRQPGAARALRAVGVGPPRRRRRARGNRPAVARRPGPGPRRDGRLVTKEGASWQAAPTAH